MVASLLKSHGGELAALVTALCWTVTAMAFEYASKRVGSLAVNLLRLLLAFLFLSAYSAVFRGMPLPLDAAPRAWFWLFLSGLVGFVIGDLLLFRAFVLIGSRVSMLIMALAPPLAALLGWLFMDERLSTLDGAGMALTIGGIGMVITGRNRKGGVSLSYSPAGIFCALGGAFGQAGGLVLSKYGMGGYSPFSATQIRVIAGIAGFTALFFVLGAWPRIGKALKNRAALGTLTLGAFFGPFLGVSFSLAAVQRTGVGVASTIMSLVPVFIIAPAAVLFRERITSREVLGAVIAVAGTAMLFL
jgi:drug/metabolite transporter (DMT)-like permease